jgi:hypothetical protein
MKRPDFYQRFKLLSDPQRGNVLSNIEMFKVKGGNGEDDSNENNDSDDSNEDDSDDDDSPFLLPLIVVF